MQGSLVHELPHYGAWHRGTHGLEIGYPWLTIGAIVTLERYVLRPDMHVLELGSGGSTIFFAKRCASVVSVELDPSWAPRTRKALADHGVADKVVLYETTGAEAGGVVEALAPVFDLLLVDHIDPVAIEQLGGIVKGHRRYQRYPLALQAFLKLKPTGWLLIDNYLAYGMPQLDLTGWDVFRFDDIHYKGRGTLLARPLPA